MWKVQFKAEAKATTTDLSNVDGVDCQDNFAEYFDSDFTFGDDIKSGWMDFKVEDNKLYVYTTYSSDRKLTDSELEVLEDYTQGQWSDGIGEGFEQFACAYEDDGEDIFISPWFPGQTIEIKQTEI